MPLFLAALGGMLLRAIPGFVVQVLVSLGLSLVTYAGMDIAIDQFKGNALSALGGLPPEVLGMLGYMKVGQAINIVFSAMLARMTYNGMKNGAMKKLGRA